MENLDDSPQIGVGIDFGTSNSCIGVYVNGSVKIVPNKIGERITPSVVLFKKLANNQLNENDKDVILVGEDALCESFDNLKNYIYEIKRFIGLEYKNFEKMGFENSLNYNIRNIDKKPQIEITCDGITKYFTFEQISYLIIEKIINITQDFISEITKKPKTNINTAVFTVPTQFSDKQKKSILNAAKLAGIEVPRIINEPTAAALAYGIQHELTNSQNEKDIFSSTMFGDNYSVPPSANQINKSKEKIMTFDLGGGTFDLTILNISKDEDGTTNFKIELTEGDIHLGGSDFDKKLMDFCVKKFCEDNELSEEKGKEILKDYLTYRRLKSKCEAAKKLLSIKNEAIIRFDNFYNDNDLAIKINLDDFNDICKSLFQRIKDKISFVFKEANISQEDIDKVILIGGATRMSGIRNLLIDLFGENKIKSDINPDEAVAIGATLEAAKIQKEKNLKFVLQDIIPFDIGILIQNPDVNDTNHREIIHPIIPRYSKIPCNNEKKYKVNLTDRNPELVVSIYEGSEKNDRLPKTKLGEVIISGLKKGTSSYKIKLDIDVNGKLSGYINSQKLNLNNIKIEFERENKIGYVMGKKLKIADNINLNTMKTVSEKLISMKESIEASKNQLEKYKRIKDCSQIYEELISNYNSFAKFNENLYENIFIYTKEIFNLYLEILKMKKDTQIIITKIKEKMMNLINAQSYIEELMAIFKDIRNDLANEYYTIFVNYMEILNNEGIKYLSKDKKSGIKYIRYYAKLYFEQVFFGVAKFVDEEKLKTIDLNIKKLYDTQKKINQEELNKLNSFAYYIERYIKDGEFLIGETGFTKGVIKIKNIIESIKPEALTKIEIEDILDKFIGMADSYDKNQKSIEEAFCLANIIKINYIYLNIKDTEKLERYIERLRIIMDNKDEDKYQWYSRAKEIINNLNNLVFIKK